MRAYTPEEAAEIAAKQRAKAERRAELAEKRTADAEAAAQRASGAVAGIPFGQPILVGHHSERRHRAALRRQNAAMSKGVENYRKAEYHDGKAKRAAAWADEVERRAAGPRYTKADLLPGDRVSLNNNLETCDAVVVKVNEKTVAVEPTYSAPFNASGLRSMHPEFQAKYAQKVPWLKVRSAWRLVDGEWTEVN